MSKRDNTIITQADRDLLAEEYLNGGREGRYPTYAYLARVGEGDFALCSLRAVARARLASVPPPTLNPMDGCPYCKWLSERGETRLDDPCKLHQAIADLQHDLAIERRINKQLTKDIAGLKEQIGTVCADLEEIHGGLDAY